MIKKIKTKLKNDHVKDGAPDSSAERSPNSRMTAPSRQPRRSRPHRTTTKRLRLQRRQDKTADHARTHSRRFTTPLDARVSCAPGRPLRKTIRMPKSTKTSIFGLGSFIFSSSSLFQILLNHQNSLLYLILDTYWNRDRHINEKCGKDAIYYLVFQRYLIVYLFIVTIISVSVLLPINLNGTARNIFV
jgi:hypothetical protein